VTREFVTGRAGCEGTYEGQPSGGGKNGTRVENALRGWGMQRLCWRGRGSGLSTWEKIKSMKKSGEIPW